MSYEDRNDLVHSKNESKIKLEENHMKKDLIFAPVLLLFVALLGMLRYTGTAVHIGVAVMGVLVLGAYTSLTKKSWRIPALEILMRVCYGIALISGIVIMNVHGIAALAIAHKVSAALFAILLIVLFVLKLRTKKA
jgi:hypothetical protein